MRDFVECMVISNSYGIEAAAALFDVYKRLVKQYYILDLQVLIQHADEGSVIIILQYTG